LQGEAGKKGGGHEFFRTPDRGGHKFFHPSDRGGHKFLTPVLQFLGRVELKKKLSAHKSYTLVIRKASVYVFRRGCVNAQGTLSLYICVKFG